MTEAVGGHASSPSLSVCTVIGEPNLSRAQLVGRPIDCPTNARQIGAAWVIVVPRTRNSTVNFGHEKYTDFSGAVVVMLTLSSVAEAVEGLASRLLVAMSVPWLQDARSMPYRR